MTHYEFEILCTKLRGIETLTMEQKIILGDILFGEQHTDGYDQIIYYIGISMNDDDKYEESK